jgi:uncharacterized protein (DUF736 family)
MIIAGVLALALLLIADQSPGLSADAESVWRVPAVAWDLGAAWARVDQDDREALEADVAATQRRAVASTGPGEPVAQDADLFAAPVPGPVSRPRSPPSA